MPRTVRAALIQASNAIPTDRPLSHPELLAGVGTL